MKVSGAGVLSCVDSVHAAKQSARPYHWQPGLQGFTGT